MYLINKPRPTIEDSDFVNDSKILCGAAPRGGEGANNSVLIGYEVVLQRDGNIVFSYFGGWQITRTDGQPISNREVAVHLLAIMSETILGASEYIRNKYGFELNINEPIYQSALVAISEMRHGLN